MSRPKMRFLSRVCCTVAVIWVWTNPPPAAAADFDALDCSIKEIPADASFYVALLRNREQVEAVMKSKAWAKLIALPFLQQGWQMAQLEMNKAGNPFEEFQQWVKVLENQQMMDLLLDMVSHEIFVYGGGNVAEFGDFNGRLMTNAQMRGFLLGLQKGMAGQEGDKVSDEEIAKILLPELMKNLKSIQVPEMIVGFKVTSPDKAASQLKRMEKVIREQVARVPELKGRLKWAKVGGNDFLTLTLDSTVMKFDDQMIRKYEKKPGEYDALIKRIKELRVTISLGVRGKYVLLAVGETTAAVEKLGKGKRLIDQPELKPLAKYADRRLTAIGYVSKAFQSQTSSSYYSVEKWVDASRAAVPNSGLAPELRTRIEKDLATLSKEIKAATPKPGAELSFGFLTPRGKEAYSYDWSEQPGLDGSKPLTILNHVGGDPLLLAAGRAKYSPEAWPKFVQWIKVLHGYFEDFGVTQMQPEEQKSYQEFLKRAKPLLTRFDTATGKMFLPSLADGQRALVLDAKLSSKQWIATLPMSPKPVRILEPALVYGVSDAAQLRKAMSEYRAILNEVITAAQQAAPMGFPLPQVPAPETRKVKGGTVYYYPFPEDWGLDKQLLPNAGLSEKIVTLSISAEHSERLLTTTPLKAAGGPLADLKRPLAGVAYIHAAGLTDLLADWLGLAEQLAPGGKEAEDALKQAREFFALLKVFRGYASASYFEGSALVTHAEFHLVDIK